LQRKYWRFYWPLAVTGLVLLLSRQVQNGVLASYEGAERVLSTFAVASSTFSLSGAMLVFVPQMANVLARSDRARRRCLRFIVAACAAISLPMVLAAFTAPGRAVLGWAFDITEPRLTVVVTYIRCALPLILIHGLRHYFTGLLVQARRTGTVTVLNVTDLTVMVAALLVGRGLGWSPLRTLVVAQLLAGSAHMVLAGALCALRYRPPRRPQHADLTYGELLRFFCPMAATSLMFAFSRPVIYAFVRRSPDADATVAALRVAFDFAMIFHSPLNQFRHFFVTFAADETAPKRRFTIRVVAFVTVVMVFVVATPLCVLILHELIGVPSNVAGLARQTLWVMCLVPLIVTTRNAFHGRLLNHRRTIGMAAGGVCRAAAIYLASWSLHRLGAVDHMTGAGVLLLGFAVEAAVAAGFSAFLPSRNPALEQP